ncbi:MAG TPA: ABC transporter permease [Chryseolinea sp.]|nr:ABC transporter permease [Chryseolinea sp.]
MIRNYLKIAWRNVVKNKMYSAINVGGLAVGMAVAMMIGLWVYDEVTYNHSHENYEHIALVYRRNTEPLEQKTYSTNGLPQPVAKILTEKYGHLFKHVALLWWDQDYTIRVDDKSFIKTGQFIDKDVIDLFSLKMLKGSKESLYDQRAIIVSESTARALFGDKDPINQYVKLNATMDASVTGVYADVASNSLFGHIQFFGNFEGLKVNTEALKANENNWGNNAYRVIVQTADNVSVEQADVAIANLYLKDSPGAVAEYSTKYKTNLWLHPMKDWYLYSELKDGHPAGGRITFVWLFTVVGGFVLVLACINFINLSTARNEKRAKEVGIRKAIGSMKSQLINQFLSESFLVVLMSLVITLLLVVISLSPFNELADKKIELPFTNLYFWLACAVVLIVTSFVAGLYPAFYLSSFQPVKVLKGTLRVGKFAALPRKILVVIQVTVSVVLVIGTIIVYQQIQFTQGRPVGYDREGLIRIPIHDVDLNKNKLVMKDALLNSGAASAVGFSSSPVTAIWDNWSGFTWKDKDPESESGFTVTWVNEDYGKTIQWKVLQGRDFSREYGTDKEVVVINQAAAKYLGLENPVGEFITHDSDKQQRQIIGVVDDVVALSPYEPVSAGFYWLENNTDNLGQMQIRLNSKMSAEASLSKIESIQNKLAPSSPFEYSFADVEYGNKFRAEQRIGKLASVFSVLAILISCLGLFGLSSFVAEQKTKEIGVRKVLGASILNIWSLISKEFIVLVLISFIIAAPIAYYYLQQWLATYDYRTDISPLVFVYSGTGALIITLATVSFQSTRAAIANPVTSLRRE